MAVTAVCSAGKTGLPVVLHADDGPAILLRLLVERRREGTQFDVRQSAGRAVGVFARRIIVQHQQHEPRAAAALRVFQHLLVAVGVAERGDGPATDVLVDADGLAALVVIEIQLRQTHEHRLAVAHFKLRLDAAADDLLRRDAVNLFRPRAHELDAAAGDDEVLETVRAQVGEHFEHRLIDHFGEELAGLRMFRGRDPVLDDLLELHRGHARVRGHDEFQQRVVAAGERGLQIALEQRGERFLVLPFGMLRRERLHAVEREVKLNGHRLLAPERAVVVERGDAFRHRHEVRRALLRDLRDELDDGLLRLAVVPRRKRVGGPRNGWCESQRANERGGDEICLRIVFIICLFTSSVAPSGGAPRTLRCPSAKNPARPRPCW